MTPPNSRDEAFLMLPELALGMLTAAEAARVMDFVQKWPELQAELASLRGSANTLASAAPAAPREPELAHAMRDRLLARAAAGNATDATGFAEVAAPPVITPLRLERVTPPPQTIVREVRTPPSLLQTLSPLFAMAAVGGFVISLVRASDLTIERNDARSALSKATATATQLEAQLRDRDGLVNLMSGAGVRVVEMASTSNRQPGARMFWNPGDGHWMMVTHDLKPVSRGRTYQLWLVTADASKISAGTFNTDAGGRAFVHATYALPEADLAAIAITEEPDGGSMQPTGEILVAGAPTR
jgi:anti-sigma-K factor RskA